MNLPSVRDSIQKIEALDWLFEELVSQIEKDLNLPENELKSRVSRTSEILEFLEEKLVQIIDNSPSGFSQILYIIDVSELQLKKKMSSGNYKTFESLCSNEILEREIKKVVLRNILKGKIKI